LTRLIVQPADNNRLGDFLNEHLRDPQWTEFNAAVAFVKYSGVRQIEEELANFSRRAAVRIAVGVDCQGSSVEGLTALLSAVGNNGQIWVFHNENASTFHPKIYMFRQERSADVVVGSGNLTAGGLFTNYEASLALRFALNDPAELDLFLQFDRIIHEWTDPAAGTARQLDLELLQRLASSGYIVTEAQQREDAEEGNRRLVRNRRKAGGEGLFSRVRVQPPPRIGLRGGRRAQKAASLVVPAVRAVFRGFVMTLQRTDVGHGQTRRGTAPRSPEIFVPLGARDYAPDFWGWRQQFVEDARHPGKWDRGRVRIRLGTEIIEVNMMTWPRKHDFRLRNEKLRSAGRVRDILRIERADGIADYEYNAEVVPRESTEYEYYWSLCDHATPNSERRWGYYL
jgi:HKD family nuclease